MSFKTGIPQEKIKDELLPELSPKVAYDVCANMVWVRNYVKRQYLRTAQISAQLRKGIFKDISRYDCNHQFIKEFNTLYRQSLEGLQTRQGKGKGNLKDLGLDLRVGIGEELGVGIGIRAGFEEFWKVYPKKRSKRDAQKAWEQVKPNESLVATILATIQSAKTSDDWKRENGQFIPYPATWLRRHGWEDEYERLSSMTETQQRLSRKVYGDE